MCKQYVGAAVQLFTGSDIDPEEGLSMGKLGRNMLVMIEVSE